MTRRRQAASEASWIALAVPQQGQGEALRAEKKNSTKAQRLHWRVEGGMDHLSPRDATDMKKIKEVDMLRKL